ncbi:MAG TPA: hypothetical protein VGH23_10765 [Rhizomicrobium sp.]|jgi:hypothetical protein
MAAANIVLIIGFRGSDAGYSYVDSHGVVHHVPGWGPEQLQEVATAARMIAEATSLKTPAVSKAVLSTLSSFVQEQVAAHVKEGGISVISAP